MILCCGESLIDMIPRPLEEGGEGYVPHPGGAIFNTAIALGRLGTRVGLLSGVSTDLFGEMLCAAMDESNVSQHYLVRSDRPSTLAFVHLDQGQARYSFFDENSAGRMVELEDLPEEAAEAQVLFFGGISLVSEPAAETFCALAARESANRLTMLDPNIRPSFVVDEDKYRSRINAMITHSDIVKISDEDLDWLDRGNTSSDDKATRLLDLGPKIVLLTRGKNGSTAFHHRLEPVHVAAEDVTVVDTVGAGDAFNAGFLSALSVTGYASKLAADAIYEKLMEDYLKFASLVAAKTVERSGANPPWNHEV